MTASQSALAAIVPAGGRARRFGSDKTLARVDGTTLVSRVVEACRALGADPIVMVGPEANAPDGVLVTREEPAFGGPVAALAAGLAALAVGDGARGDAELVAVVAADMPFVAGALPALLAAVEADVQGSRDGAWAVDADGRHQPLLAVYRVAALRAVVGALGDPADAPMRAVTATMDLVEVPVGAAGIDIDTPEALARAGGVGP